MSPSSEGVLDAVAVKRRERQSSSEEAARRSDKTFNKASRREIRERRPDAVPDVLVRAVQARERNTKAEPDMRTGQSAQTCLRREVPTDHEARNHTQRGQLRMRVTYALSNTAIASTLRPSA